MSGRRCYYCKCPFNHDDPTSRHYPTRDHKLPKSKGGRNHAKNIVWACRRCNEEKANKTVAEFRAMFAS